MITARDLLLDRPNRPWLTFYEVRHPIPGQRHNTETIYVRHRFPVKGGITQAEYIAVVQKRMRDRLLASLAAPNRLLEGLKVRR